MDVEREQEMMKTIYAGCDPGVKGALAIIDGEKVRIIGYDKDEYLKELELLGKQSCRLCLEQVHSITKQGISSAFTFGTNFGWLQGVLEANAIPYQLISPQRWKKDFGCTSDKNTSIEVCKRLFPGASLKRTERCKKDDDGFAEALLMALYAKRHF